MEAAREEGRQECGGESDLKCRDYKRQNIDPPGRRRGRPQKRFMYMVKDDM